MLRLSLCITLLCLATIPSLAADSELPQVPSNVTWMYVFLQNPSSTAKGSGREIATMITPDDFRKNFSSYRQLAKGGKMKLIVTAETKDRLWVQEQIRFKGVQLSRAPYYNPGIDRVVPGAVVPLE